MSRTIMAVTGMCCAALLTACAGDVETERYTTYRDHHTSDEQTDRPADNDVTSEETDTYEFGDTYRGAVDTTVRNLGTITTSEYAQPAGDDPAWVVEFEFTNNTAQTFFPAFFQIDATVDGAPADEVFDHEQGLEGVAQGPSAENGETVRITAAFAGEGEDHAVEVASMDGSETIEFTNK